MCFMIIVNFKWVNTCKLCIPVPGKKHSINFSYKYDFLKVRAWAQKVIALIKIGFT